MSISKFISWYVECYVNKYYFVLILFKLVSKLLLMDDWGNNMLNGNVFVYFEVNLNYNIGLEFY